MSARLAEAPLPSFLEGRYACAAGEREYWLYVPGSFADRFCQGMIVMLHGGSQDPQDFARGTRMNSFAEMHGLLVVYPAQSSRHNFMNSWNWFRPGDQRRGAGEPAIIAGLTESLRAEHGIPRDRVFVAGLSAGGAMASILGETYPELYAAIGVHSGLARGSASDVFSAFMAMRGPVEIDQGLSVEGSRGPMPRMIVFHGSADTKVHPSNAARIVACQERWHGKASRAAHMPLGEVRAHTRLIATRADGTHGIECWTIEGARHAWSGGSSAGSHTDPRGPDASAAMVRFFLEGAADLELGPITATPESCVTA